MLKQLLPLIAILISNPFISQENLEIIVKPKSENIYPNEKIELDIFLVNNGEEKISVPIPQKMSSMPKKFVYQNILLYNSQDSLLNSFRCGVSGPVKNVRMPSNAIFPGHKLKLKTFTYTFSDTGSYKLNVEYFLDGRNKPEGSTIDFKAFHLKTLYEFEVIKKQPIPLVAKTISFEEFSKAPVFSLSDKIYDSTNVFRLKINNGLTAENIAALRKLKNVKGLYISSQEPFEIPDELFETDLYELTFTFFKSDPETVVDLRKLSNLTSLRGFRLITANGLRNNILFPEDLSHLKFMTGLEVCGVVNDFAFPVLPQSISSVSFKEMKSLNGLEGDFSKHTKLGKMSIEYIDSFEMPEKIQGNIYRLSFNQVNFDNFPDISGLTLSSFSFNGYTGNDVPDYFTNIFRNGSYITFPKHLEGSKSFKKLSKKKLKNRVFAHDFVK